MWDGPRNTRIWHPGTLVNIFVGAVTGWIYWALYNQTSAPVDASTLAGACLGGVGGGPALLGLVNQHFRRSATKSQAESIDTMGAMLEAEAPESDTTSQEG